MAHEDEVLSLLEGSSTEVLLLEDSHDGGLAGLILRKFDDDRTYGLARCCRHLGYGIR